MNMIKKAVSSFLVALTLGAAGTASAAIIDTITKDPDVLISAPSTTFSYFHDITDDGFVFNFDNVTSAEIVVRLTDDMGNEDYRITVGDQIFNSGKNENVANSTFNEPTGGRFVSIDLSAFSLADLNADGMIGLTISSTSNSFYFAGSTLTAQVAPGQIPGTGEVPEPATIALLGLGLLGFAASRRKSAKSKNA